MSIFQNKKQKQQEAEEKERRLMSRLDDGEDFDDEDEGGYEEAPVPFPECSPRGTQLPPQGDIPGFFVPQGMYPISGIDPSNGSVIPDMEETSRVFGEEYAMRYAAPQAENPQPAFAVPKESVSGEPVSQAQVPAENADDAENAPLKNEAAWILSETPVEEEKKEPSTAVETACSYEELADSFFSDAEIERLKREEEKRKNKERRAREREEKEKKEKEEKQRKEKAAREERERRILKKTINEIRDQLKKDFGSRILTEKYNKEFRGELEEAVWQAILDRPEDVPIKIRENVKKQIVYLVIGLGAIEPLLEEGKNEIMVSRYDRIFVEEKGKMVLREDAKYTDEEELQTIIKEICSDIGKSINATDTIVDGYLRDGSRFNAVFPPVSPDGAVLTIRRFPKHSLTGMKYKAFESVDDRMLRFLKLSVLSGWCIIASGGTGSGKTSLLNLLSSFIPKDESVITIEDSLELNFNHPNVRRKLTRKSDLKEDTKADVDTTRLVKNALRERPDRIVVGEIRGGEMVDFLDAANSGHEGCLTTVHANSPKALTTRVCSLYKKGNSEGYTTNDIKRLYADSVDLIVQIKRYPDTVRRISHIAHVVGYGADAAEELGIKPGDIQYKENEIYVKDIFKWQPDGGKKDENGKMIGHFMPTGYIPAALLEKAADNGIVIDESIFKPDFEVEEWTEEDDK